MLKAKLIAFLISRLGSVISGVIAALVAAGVAQLAHLSPDLAARVNQTEVTGFLWAAVMVGVNFWTNKIQTRGVTGMQQALAQSDHPVVIDGYLGDKTAHALELETGLPVRRAVAAQ